MYKYSPIDKLFNTGLIEMVLFSGCVKDVVVGEGLVLSKDDLRLVRSAKCAHATHVNLLSCILRTDSVCVCVCMHIRVNTTHAHLR